MALTKIDDRGLKTPIDLLDNEKIRFGTGNDLEIFHDATHTYINNTTGDLRITDTGGGGIIIGTDSLALRNSARDENYLTGNVNGAVELYYNNVKKFETTDVGVLATGHIFSTTKFRGNDDVKVSLGTSEDLQIYHDGDHSKITSHNTGDLYLQSVNDDIVIRAADNIVLQPQDGENGINISGNGSVELYYDNSKKLETHGNGTQLTGNLGIGIAPNTDVELHISHDGSATLPTFGAGTKAVISGTANNSAYIALDILGGNSTGASIINFGDADDEDAGEIFYFHSDNSMSFRTNNSNDNKLQITSGGNILIPNDSGKLQLGASQDLQIYHNGTNSYINESSSGSLWIGGDSILITNAANSEYQAKFIADGASELRYDGSKKFETYSGGVLVTGTLNIPDGSNSDNRITLGDGGDLKIYHDGTNSFLENTTGTLKISVPSGSDHVQINKGAVDENMAKFIADGAVELYYDSAKKFETTSGGVNVTGTVTTDGLTCDGASYFNADSVFDGATAGRDMFWDRSNNSLRFYDNALLLLGNDSDLQLYHTGSHSHISDRGGAGNLNIESNNQINIKQNDAEHYMAKFVQAGTVELYYDNVKKFETQANGVTVFGSEGLKLYTENGNNTDTNSIVWRGGSDSQQANVAQIVAKQVSDWGGQLFIKVKKNDGALNDNYATVLNAKGDSNGFVELCTDSNARLQVQSTGFKAGATIPGDHATGGLIINSAGESSLYRSNNGIVFIIGGPQSGQKLVEFRHTSTGIGNISKGNSDTAINYNTTNSDRTLKKNFEDWTDSYWTGFKDLKPQKFNFLYQEDSDPKIKGYIAQDLASTFPEAYPKDAETDKYMFNPSGMVPYLMKTLQEAIVEIETLKTKVAALESS